MLTGLESISTVKALQIANKTGVLIYKISSTNINSVLPLLNVSQEVKNEIQNAINAGKEVTISRDKVQFNSWSGVGYIVRDFDGAGAYMISSGTAGTDTTQPVSGCILGLLSGRTAALAEGKPANSWLSKEDMELYDKDLEFMIDIGNMLLGKGYIPKVEKTFTRQQLIEFANNKKNWIFYYSGHGGGNTAESYMAPLPPVLGVGGGEFVDPPDVHADMHIVFLNSCDSASSLGFVNAFGIDQKYQEGTRDEIFLGWRDTVNWEETSRFGLEWWKNMYAGMTAEEAVLSADLSTEAVYEDYGDLKSVLVRQGNLNAKLY